MRLYFQRVLFFLIVLSFLAVSVCRAGVDRPMPADLKFPPLSFTPPKPEKVKLKNGMTLFLLRDSELPVLNVQAMIRTGSIYDPDQKDGLAELAATVMRTGGTTTMTGDAIEEELEFIAGNIGLHSNWTNVSATLSVLKKDTDKGLKIFSAILMHPVFEEKKIDLARKALVESIRRKNDDSGEISAREFRKLVYAGHPFGREPTIKSVSSLRREDLLHFHKQWFYPNRIIMSVSGDFRRDEIIRKIEKAFQGWQAGGARLPKIKPLKKRFPYSVNYMGKDISLSVVRLGHLGVKISNPDHYALQIMNNILGGSSFQSRLMQHIRTDRGLAYSVWSHFGAGVFDYDTFLVALETKSSSTVKVIRLVLDDIRKMRQERVSREELDNAKQFIENSFVFKFSNSARIVNRMAFFEYYGVPADYMKTYLENIRKVTREEVNRVAGKYLRPDGIIITVVGNRKKFDQPLSVLGKVHTIPLNESAN